MLERCRIESFSSIPGEAALLNQAGQILQAESIRRFVLNVLDVLACCTRIRIDLDISVNYPNRFVVQMCGS